MHLDNLPPSSPAPRPVSGRPPRPPWPPEAALGLRPRPPWSDRARLPAVDGVTHLAVDVTDAEQVQCCRRHRGSQGGAAAQRGQLRRHRPSMRILGRKGPHDLDLLRRGRSGQPDRLLQRAHPRGREDRSDRAARARPARLHRQHRIGCGLRGADRPGGVRLLQSRHRRPHAAGGPRPRAVRHPRQHHRPRHRRDPDAGDGLARSSEQGSRPESPSRSGSGGPTSSPTSRCSSSSTTTSTARRSASTERCAWRPADAAIPPPARPLARVRSMKEPRVEQHDLDALIARTTQVVRDVALPLDDEHDGDIEAAGGEAARATLQARRPRRGGLRPARAGRLRRPRPGHGGAGARLRGGRLLPLRPVGVEHRRARRGQHPPARPGRDARATRALPAAAGARARSGPRSR